MAQGRNCVESVGEREGGEGMVSSRCMWVPMCMCAYLSHDLSLMCFVSTSVRDVLVCSRYVLGLVEYACESVRVYVEIAHMCVRASARLLVCSPVPVACACGSLHV